MSCSNSEVQSLQYRLLHLSDQDDGVLANLVEFNVSVDGEVVVIADAAVFEVLGRTSLGELCRSTPAVAAGRMFFRSVGRLFALDPVADGR